MRPSDDRINFLSHHIAERMLDEGLLAPTDKSVVSQEVKKAFVRYFQKEEEADERARSKVKSIKRGIPEGSAEWEILYNKFLEEELVRLLAF